MFKFLSPNIALGIGGALLISGIIYTINDYINVKSAYKVAQKTIAVQEHHRQMVDIQSLKAEKKQYDNFNRERNALVQLDDKGYLSDNNGSNPIWLRPTSKNGG